MAAEERSTKKPRTENAAAVLPPVASVEKPNLQTLVAAPSQLQGELSPGAMHGSRVAALGQLSGSTFAALFASGPRIYSSTLQPPAGTQLEHGKEGVLIPKRTKTGVHLQQLEPLTQRWEVQSLAVTEAPGSQLLLATVDSSGRGMRARLQWQEPTAAAAAAGSDHHPAAAATAEDPPWQLEVVGVDALLPAASNREPGWAGVALCPQSPSTAAVARSPARELTLYDGTTPLRTWYPLAPPLSLAFLPLQAGGGGGAPGQLISVTEGHLVTIYDARVGEGSGVVARVTSAASPGQALYSQGWCRGQGGLLGVAGAERSVSVLEPRKWRPVSKWSSAGRQALTHLSFLEGAPEYACVTGLDYEVMCARWQQQPSGRTTDSAPAAQECGRAVGPRPPPAPAAAAADEGEGREGGPPGQAVRSDQVGFLFRGDARWMGFSKASSTDVFAGLGASGNLFYAQVGAPV